MHLNCCVHLGCDNNTKVRLHMCKKSLYVSSWTSSILKVSCLCFFNEVRLNQKRSMLAQWGCLFVLPTACWGKVQLKFKYVDIAWSCVANRINVAEIVHRVPTQVAPGENDISHVIPVSKNRIKAWKFPRRVSAETLSVSHASFSRNLWET